MRDVVRSLVLRIAEEGAISDELFRPNAVTLEAMRELEEGRGRTSIFANALIEELDAERHPGL